MKKIIKIGIKCLLVLSILLCSCKKTEKINKFVYQNDPRINMAAMNDIDVDNNAIYGFVPSRDSKRLAEFSEFDYSEKKWLMK